MDQGLDQGLVHSRKRIVLLEATGFCADFLLSYEPYAKTPGNKPPTMHIPHGLTADNPGDAMKEAVHVARTIFDVAPRFANYAPRISLMRLSLDDLTIEQEQFAKHGDLINGKFTVRYLPVELLAMRLLGQNYVMGVR